MSVRFIRFVTIPIAAGLLSVSVQGQQENKQNFRLTAVRVDRPIELTGTMSDPLWQLAPTAELKFETTPGENIPAEQKTVVRVLYDNDFVYVAATCFDTRIAELRANLSDRDKMFSDDWFGFWFDTYGDDQRRYDFLVNPYGIQGDLFVTPNNADESFDAVWKSETSIGIDSWTVEMAIPLKSIRFPESPVQNWTVMFTRQYPRETQKWFSWTPLNRNLGCQTCQGGTLEGITNIQSHNAVELLPYILANQSAALSNGADPNSSLNNGAVNSQIGTGIRWAPTSELAIEGVINPDFSQVESDAGQVGVNSSFALFYPEKRPFFLQGSDAFSTNMFAYYSRMMNSPLFAGRVQSKTTDFSFSYLTGLDRKTPFIVGGEEGSNFVNSNLESFSNVFSGKYNLGGQSFIGGILTTRNIGGDGHNYAGGLNWNYFFGDVYTFTGSALYSSTKEIDNTSLLSSTRKFGNLPYDAAFNGESFDGTGVRMTLFRRARDFGYSLTLRDVSPAFMAYNGFVFPTNSRSIEPQAYYAMYFNDGFFTQVRFVMTGLVRFNYDGLHKEDFLGFGFNLNMKAQTFVQVLVYPFKSEIYHGISFPYVERWMIYTQTSPVKFLTASVSFDEGKYIFRSAQPQMGRGFNLQVGLTLLPSSNFSTEVTYTHSQLKSYSTGADLYDGYIARWANTYQFSREFFFRLISEYNQFSHSLQVYPLLSYKLNPFTIFYIGATGNYQDFQRNDPSNSSLPSGLFQTDRQFFAKLQYLIQP